MSYTPVIAGSGYAGWSFLQRTMEKQQAAYAASAEIKTDDAYFRENIRKVTSAEDLVADRRLMKVTLGAFGLQDDINNRFFIRKVLEDGTDSSKDLANRLTNKAYHAMSETFGFGTARPVDLSNPELVDQLLADYKSRQFEVAVGKVDDRMRIALNAQRELPAILGRDTTDNTKWYTILGAPPLRSLMETAFGLPSAFSSLDIDRQVSVLKERADRYLGSDKVNDLAAPATLEKLTKLYLLRSALTDLGSVTGSRAALTLLRGG